MSISLFVEGLVILLLITTLGYTFVLNRRLKKLRMDEAAFRATITDLLSATEGAERAVKTLKQSAGETAKGLAVRIRDADRLNTELAERLEDGDALLEKLVAILQSATPAKKVVKREEPAPRRPRMMSEGRRISELAAEATERINSYRRNA